MQISITVCFRVFTLNYFGGINNLDPNDGSVPIADVRNTHIKGSNTWAKIRAK